MSRRFCSILIFFVCTLFLFTACQTKSPQVEESSSAVSSAISSVASEPSQESQVTQETSEGSSATLTVHYLDVGQGDSIFIELPNGKCMLIDASESKQSEKIIGKIRLLGYETLDYVIATHPHADHIGGMRKVIEAFSVGCIYLPDVSANTETYIKLVETILKKDIKAEIASEGKTVLQDPSLDLEAKLLAPKSIDSKDMNRNSAVLLLTYKDNRFLFMGDADTEIEGQLKMDVRCDVLKVGHHGSRTASSESFLSRAKPSYAIISCGTGNDYGHPHAEALERLSKSGATVLRTDQKGTIVISSDGSHLTVSFDTEEEPVESTPSFRWILNTSSKKIHSPDCKYAKEISQKNYKESDETLQALLEQGYTTCGSCKPS